MHIEQNDLKKDVIGRIAPKTRCGGGVVVPTDDTRHISDIITRNLYVHSSLNTLQWPNIPPGATYRTPHRHQANTRVCNALAGSKQAQKMAPFIRKGVKLCARGLQDGLPAQKHRETRTCTAGRAGTVSSGRAGGRSRRGIALFKGTEWGGERAGFHQGIAADATDEQGALGWVLGESHLYA